MRGKMWRRMSALVLSGLLVLSGCSLGDEEETTVQSPSATRSVETVASPATTAPATTEAAEPEPTDKKPILRSVAMKANANTGEIIIDRAQLGGKAVGEKGSWTIFVYLCGADLESDGGAASADLQEMLDASGSDRVRFVVETGGASAWKNKNVSAKSLQRFVIQNGTMEKVDEVTKDSMGKAGTLAQFLQWGMNQYPAERMGLVLWNHGSGSINGVCFDENYDNDSLDIKEMDAALLNACDMAGATFEFIGFDACLMATVEVASMAATYARYLVASQETEPGSGWDYTAMGNFLAQNPEADGAALGKVICDNFYESCRRVGEEASATLSVLDLTKLDAFISAYNTYLSTMYTSLKSDSRAVTTLVRGIVNADNFGGNNRSEGYTNMVDLAGILGAAEEVVPGTAAVTKALQAALVYQVKGGMHPAAGGLSTYYPLQQQGSKELDTFSKICVSPFYLSVVDMLLQAGTQEDVGLDDYDNSHLFDEDGSWGLFFDYLLSDDGDYEADASQWEDDEDYWEYTDDWDVTGASPYITFEQAPGLDDEGNFCFVLDDEGYANAANVFGCVWLKMDDDMIIIGETFDVKGDWETGEFMDYFDGSWIALPDGQMLSLYIVGETEDYYIYTSPIALNDEVTNLRLLQDLETGEIFIEGIWDGIDENGCSSRVTRTLEEGDIICPLYMVMDSDEFYYGDEYEVTGDDALTYDDMLDGMYYYAFEIDDIYGDYLLTDAVMYEVEDGEVYYNEH